MHNERSRTEMYNLSKTSRYRRMQSQARYTWSEARVSLSSRLSKTLRSPTELPTLKDGFASNLSRDLAELRTYGLGEYQDLGTGGTLQTDRLQSCLLFGPLDDRTMTIL